MPDITKLKDILLLLGIPVGGVLVVVVAVLLALWLYPQFRLLLGDILKLFGHTGRWVRRKSIECEMEGTINAFAKGFNSDLTVPLLPECSVRWVNEKSAETFLVPGRAIVRVSFGQDRDVNLFHAAKAFVKASLIPRTKPFLRLSTTEAVDLLVTRNLLRDSRREALKAFNTEFRKCPEESRDQFHRLAETDDAGLFKRILLQELHFFAEALGDRAPQPEHGEEADAFVNWLYDLAVREPEEFTQLAFDGRNIRVGVILVAQSGTYLRHGLEPYLRRARMYAAREFPCIYLLARGSRKNEVTRRLVDELCSDGCFECLTRQPATLARGRIDGEDVVVSCYCLRTVPLAVIQRAWETCRAAYGHETCVVATVQQISHDGVEVDACGLRVTISNENLSEMGLSNGYRYFHRYDELSLKVLECDEERDVLVLSNRGTDSDPKRAVEAANLSDGESAVAVVERVVTKDGAELGLTVSLAECTFGGFIPRSQATHSRFVPLSDTYHAADRLEVTISSFDPSHANYLCTISTLRDPWAEGAPSVGAVVAGPTRLIRDSLVIFEPEPGLEAWCPYDELAWGDDQQKRAVLDSLSVGDEFNGVVTRVDVDGRRAYVSRRRLTGNPGACYLRDHRGEVLLAKVASIDGHGALLALENTDVPAFLPCSEMEWSYCSDPHDFVAVGDELQVRVMSYDDYHENLTVSRKRVIENSFADFQSQHQLGDDVLGLVRAVLTDRVLLAVSFAGNHQVMAYIHKAEASNIAFVEDSMLPRMFAVGHEYRATVKAMFPRFENVELTRKGILRAAVSGAQYGDEHDVACVSRIRGGLFVHGGSIEGILVDSSASVGSRDVRVFPARIDKARGEIEFHAG